MPASKQDPVADGEEGHDHQEHARYGHQDFDRHPVRQRSEDQHPQRHHRACDHALDAEDAAKEIFLDLFLQQRHARSVQERDDETDETHQEEVNPEIRDDTHPESAQAHRPDRKSDGMDSVLEAAP